MRALVIALLAVSLSGCAALGSVLAAAQQGGQWLGSLVALADDGQRSYFARHPSQEREQSVLDGLLTARGAVAAYDAVLALGEAADRGDVDAARAAAVEAYGALRDLLAELGVLTATPPPGGAETTAPAPRPLALPTAADVAKRM